MATTHLHVDRVKHAAITIFVDFRQQLHYDCYMISLGSIMKCTLAHNDQRTVGANIPNDVLT